jgi:hypothetical protein
MNVTRLLGPDFPVSADFLRSIEPGIQLVNTTPRPIEHVLSQ